MSQAVLSKEKIKPDALVSRKALAATLLATGLFSLVMFAVVSWPLPRFWAEGIPSSAQNLEQPPWRMMIAGDHLQLLYHFDLVNDMLTGQIPWLQNPYEFNEGDDAARFRRSAYFLPMSGVYAVLAIPLRQAAAWNTTLWISVWFSAFFTWLWLRRFTADPWALSLGVLVVILSPYRWISLFGGSPAGISLMWLPLLAWAVDVAVREGTWASGVWAGVALVFLFWADLQVFYFAALSLPFFAGLSLAVGWMRNTALPWRRWVRVLPGLLSGVAVIGIFYSWRKNFIADSNMAAGRSLTEVGIFSPHWSGFFVGGRGPDDSIFLGVAVVLASGLALVRMLVVGLRGDRHARRLLVVSMLLVSVLSFYAVLALGTNDPFKGLVLHGVRTFAPGYDMIRQPFKIFCVIPSLIAWILVLGLAVPHEADVRVKRGWRVVIVLAGMGLIGHYLYAFAPTICLLAPEQEAYAAVAQEARDVYASVPRAVAVPLWPGDSSETTVPLHYAHRHGIRLLNGYSPVVRKAYMEGIYRRFESINQGVLDDEQIEALLARGIRYVLLHENRYPEKVSPFPVHEALRRFRAHPRMALMKQDGPVYAFRLLEVARPVTEQDGFPLFPARRWEAETFANVHDAVVADETALGEGFWRATASAATAKSKTIRIAPSDHAAWWLRIRGAGRIDVATFGTDGPLEEQTMKVEAAEWEWRMAPLPDLEQLQPVTLHLKPREGTVDVDMVFLGTSDWSFDEGSGAVALPAAAFFRSGYTDEDGTSVVFRRDYEPGFIVFYGPRLPLPPGAYDVDWMYSTDAPAGTVLAWVQGAQSPVIGDDWQPILAGQAARLPWRTTSNLPSSFRMKFARNADFTLKEVRITRIAGVDP